ncbi:MAG: NAD(P)H-dependent oxidoreductase subunit E, partial [Dehalococcoidales bacterium]|nr:NAD(P)H-dependent oxidoreductase subunit E [Dehalococcoidales bacterium]
GRNIIRACRGTACHVRGGKAVLEAIENRLGISDGQTTPDYRFTLETVACLGACAMGPVVLVDSKYYGKMTPGKVEALIENLP